MKVLRCLLLATPEWASAAAREAVAQSPGVAKKTCVSSSASARATS